MKRYYILLILFPVLLTGCEVYFVTNQQDQSTYDQPIAEPIMYPIYDPAPPPQPPTGPIYLPQPGITNPVASPTKPAPQPSRPGSDLHESNNRNGVPETRTAPTSGRTTEPTNTNNPQKNTQPARTEGGRR